MSEELELATAELLGAVAYGQLRSFEATARTVRLAPDVRRADGVAAIAVGEHDAYVALRDHLAARTSLPWAVMERQKPHFDAYFDRAPLQDWFGASVFFALGLPIAADFSRAIAPALDDAAADLLLGSVAGKQAFERQALDELASQLDDEDAKDRARHLVADLLGRALTSYQGAVSDTDALRVLLTADTVEGESGEQRVKRLALDVMSGHRRRAVALGLEDLEDVR